MTTTSIQDRTAEFRAVLAQAQKRQSSTKVGAQRQSLLTETQRRAANGSPNGEAKGSRRGARSDFARRAAEIGRGIAGTMEKLGRLAERMWPLNPRLAFERTIFIVEPSAIENYGDQRADADRLWRNSREKENTIRRSACGNQ